MCKTGSARIKTLFTRTRRWSLPAYPPHQRGPHAGIALPSLPENNPPSSDFPTGSQSQDLPEPRSSRPISSEFDIPTSLVPLPPDSRRSQATSSDSFDGATLNVETVFATPQAFSQRPSTRSDPTPRCRCARKYGYCPLPSSIMTQSPVEGPEQQPGDPFISQQAHSQTVPWPSSDDSVMPPPTWSSKSSLERTLYRRRSRSMSTRQRPVSEWLGGAVRSHEAPPFKATATATSSDQGATAGTQSSEGDESQTRLRHREAFKNPNIDLRFWRGDESASAATLDSRRSTWDGPPEQRSRASLLTVVSQGASDSVLRLSTLTFSAFTLFMAFYTLVEMRAFFSLTLAEIKGVKSMLSKEASTVLPLKASQCSATKTLALFRPWFEVLLGVWLVTIAGMVCCVVWEFCPNAIKVVQNGARHLYAHM